MEAGLLEDGDGLGLRIPTHGRRTRMQLRVDNCVAAKDFIAIFFVLELLIVIVSRAAPAPNERAVFGILLRRAPSSSERTIAVCKR